jgi:hypothetical protein
MIDAVLNVTLFAALVLCIVWFGASAHTSTRPVLVASGQVKSRRSTGR